MLVVAVTSYKGFILFIRMCLYTLLGIIVLIVRSHYRKKTRKRMDERTKRMMKNTKTDENGKYPWES